MDLLEVVGEAQVQVQVALLAGEEVLEVEVLEINLQFESKKV